MSEVLQDPGFTAVGLDDLQSRDVLLDETVEPPHILLLVFEISPGPGCYSADDEEYQRKTTLTVAFTETEWWLARWSNNEIACRMYIEHEGAPTEDEIITACGRAIFDEWRKTTTCTDNSAECKGLYLYPLATYEGTREVEVELPVIIEDQPGLPTDITTQRLLMGGGIRCGGQVGDASEPGAWRQAPLQGSWPRRSVS